MENLSLICWNKDFILKSVHDFYDDKQSLLLESKVQIAGQSKGIPSFKGTPKHVVQEWNQTNI